MTFTDLVTEKKLTYYKLSKLTGIPKTTIHDISSGKSDLLNCNGKTLLSLAGALDVSIEELLHLEKEDDLRKYGIFIKVDTNLIKREKETKSLNKLSDIDRKAELKDAFIVNNKNKLNIKFITLLKLEENGL